MTHTAFKPLAALGTIAGYFAFTAVPYLSLVIKESKKVCRDDCDYLMILGGDIIGADTPSPQLLERMKAAAEYLKENTDCYIIPCGGCFRPEQKRSEAEIIADYLISNGIDPDRIILEDNSTTTFENFVFALEIIKRHSNERADNTRIAFLSSNYHMFRSTIIAKCCGLKNPGRVSCITPSDASKRFIREYFVAYDLAYRIITKKYISKRP